MVAKIPQSTAQDAYKFLSSYQGLTDDITYGLKYKRWLNDADSLIKQGIVTEGYLLRAFVNILQGDLKNAVKNAKYASQSSDEIAIYNYALLLNKNGDFSESLKIVEGLIAHNPADISAFDLIETNKMCLLDADGLNDILAKFKGSEHHFNDLSQSFAKSVTRINHHHVMLNELNFDLDLFIKFNQEVFCFIYSRYCGNISHRLSMIETEMGKQLEYCFYLNNVSIDECLQLNDDFLDVMLDKFDFNDCQKIVIRFMPKGLQ
ncbi:tetratricopeptide repeat protein [Moraxella nasicaprae]|uniref:Tetratricopeptide repeat protein n=1 Tax=Moraxella nasicaprae TaxID=2904122 RepID=A0ABY6F4B7_9GAMM|nr:hypothetical protein [Moraxella nasicaprae]UXZ04930.1 hypothetical protein LU297_00265 [Moraxella nasicaprae]